MKFERLISKFKKFNFLLSSYNDQELLDYELAEPQYVRIFIKNNNLYIQIIEQPAQFGFDIEKYVKSLIKLAKTREYKFKIATRFQPYWGGERIER